MEDNLKAPNKHDHDIQKYEWLPGNVDSDPSLVNTKLFSLKDKGFT